MTLVAVNALGVTSIVPKKTLGLVIPVPVQVTYWPGAITVEVAVKKGVRLYLKVNSQAVDGSHEACSISLPNIVSL